MQPCLTALSDSAELSALISVSRDDRGFAFAQAEPVIQANQDRLHILPDIIRERTCCWPCGCGSSPEAEEIIFEKHRPARQEHIFESPASGPSAPGDSRKSIVASYHGGWRKTAFVMSVAHPGGAALGVHQEHRPHGIADPTGQRGEPRDSRLICDIWAQRSQDSMAVALHAGSVEHSLDTKDPRTSLVIAADLTAADNARRSVRGELDPIVAPSFRSPTEADVRPEITAGPRQHGHWGDGWLRLVHGPMVEIGGTGRRTGQNGDAAKTGEQELSHGSHFLGQDSVLKVAPKVAAHCAFAATRAKKSEGMTSARNENMPPHVEPRAFPGYHRTIGLAIYRAARRPGAMVLGPPNKKPRQEP